MIWIRRGPTKTLALALVTLASSVVAQTWAENRPAAGGPHSLPTRLFPIDNWWNLKITDAAVQSNSTSLLSIYTGKLATDWGDNYGLPFTTVSVDYPKVAVTAFFAGESDTSVLYPIPAAAITVNGWSEQLDRTIANADFGTGDRHMLMVDPALNYLYEIYNIYYNNTAAPVVIFSGQMTVQPGEYAAAQTSFWTMNTNNARPDGWTSSDAAGLQVLPGLVQYDEVTGSNPITHAHRMTFNTTTTGRYVWPASHWAGGGGTIPLGARLRLKASKDITIKPGCNANGQRLLQSFKDYGLIVADNGVTGQVTGTNDARWGDSESAIRVELIVCLADIDVSDDLEIVTFGYGYLSSFDVTPTDTTATVRYGAYGIPYETDCATVLKDSGGTPITTSTSTEGFARRTAIFTGLTPSTTYKATTTCQGYMPPPVASAGVNDITFVTRATPSGGNRTVPITLKAAPVLSTAARVTVDYGTTTSVADGSVQNTSCSAGCTVNLSIPAGLRYWRARWQTSLDAVIATSSVQTLVIE